MQEFQEFKNLMEPKKSEEFLQTGKEEDLPDMPGYIYSVQTRIFIVSL